MATNQTTPEALHNALTWRVALPHQVRLMRTCHLHSRLCVATRILSKPRVLSSHRGHATQKLEGRVCCGVRCSGVAVPSHHSRDVISSRLRCEARDSESVSLAMGENAYRRRCLSALRVHQHTLALMMFLQDERSTKPIYTKSSGLLMTSFQYICRITSLCTKVERTRCARHVLA